MKNLITLFLISFNFSITIIVNPYLQNATPHSVTIMWETDSNDQSIVQFGLTENLGNTQFGIAEIGNGLSRIHTVTITELSPQTRYFYKVSTNNVNSDIFNFITPPDTHENFSFIAMSDMQRDGGNPNKFEEIVNDGIIAFLNDNYSGDISEDLGFIMIPGDLVPNGYNHYEWINYFFGQSNPLFSYVPVYPVPGNHENDSEYFFKYFHLPSNGYEYYDEHWWYQDYSNVRIIGLDSNWWYQVEEQLDWLESLLNQTCNDNNIDFVFAELHHPHKSELWLSGETEYTGNVIERLENFSTECGKPSIHFFGHTHGYSRGQSKEHQHLWINVATAGGNIDYWDEYAQNDYEEYTISLSEWGFVILDVTIGDNPKFTLKRVSRGDEYETMNNEIRDEITIRRFNDPPNIPLAISPIEEIVLPDYFTLVAEAFSDENGDEHWFSQWQISDNCESFDLSIIDKFESHENWYHEENTQEGNSLIEEEFSGLNGNFSYCWRVRFRDSGLVWSDWSSPAEFTTGESVYSANLLSNPGAENGTEEWVIREGTIESIISGECDGISPHNGNRYFNVGGLCNNESSYSEVYQANYIGDDANCIDSGNMFAYYGGYLSTWNGSDYPEFNIEFVDELGNIIESSPIIGSYNDSWTNHSNELRIPINTRIINFVMMGTRNSGSDNDSYFDDMELRLRDDCQNILLGDSNQDGIINVIDIIQIVNIILE
ncbi:MAG: metallophosphoesterase [Candidatus Marinimicrobia bacterium]|nr:metallophosphoesterase [Candidatus Neomarinimicrobiota bacterium]